MKIRWTAFCIQEVAIDPCLIDSIKLSLVAVEIRLTQGPRLSQGQLFQVIPDAEKLVVHILEPVVNFPLPTSR